MRRVEIAEDPTERLEQLVAELDPGWRPLLAPALRAQAEVLQMDPREIAFSPVERTPPSYTNRLPVRWAEVLVRNDEMFLVVLRREPGRLRRFRTSSGEIQSEELPGAWNLHISCVGPRLTSDALNSLQAAIEDLLEVTLEPYYYRSVRFQELLNEGREAPDAPDSGELDAARAFADRNNRTLATAIKSASGLLTSDAAKQLPESERSKVGDVINALQSAELVATESVVVCKKTGSQVARMPSADLLPELDEKGVRCSCGRSLLHERCEEALAITDAGRALLDGNRWFTLVLIDELLRLGVPLSSILVEQVSGGDEMDCIAVISGDMILFELKDKTFSLGNAYSFGAKIGILRPDKSMIVTTDQVGNDAKEHFQRARAAGGRSRRDFDFREAVDQDTSPMYVEGLEKLRPALEDLLTEATIHDAEAVLSEVLPHATVGAAKVLRAWRPAPSNPTVGAEAQRRRKSAPKARSRLEEAT